MHNTGNPLGSKDILDLYDNSEVVDNFVNSQQDETPDRFGQKRLTLAGLIKRSMALRNEINDFSGALTFKPEWSDVPMNVSEGVGGEGGALNLQAEALGNRSEINKITSGEALRRSCAEAGYTLVTGSFESGGKLVNASDVLLQERTGKVFSGPAGTVAAGTNPIGGGFTDQSGKLLRHNVPLVDTLAGVASGKYVVDTLVSVLDRDRAVFKVQAGASPDGFGTIAAGSGKIAVIQPTSYTTCDAFGAPKVAYSSKVGPLDAKPACQAMIDFGLPLRFGVGKYRLDSSIEFSVSQSSITGVVGGTKVVVSGDFGAFRVAIAFTAESYKCYGIYFDSINPAQGSGIRTAQSVYLSHWDIEKCTFSRNLRYGILANIVGCRIANNEFGAGPRNNATQIHKHIEATGELETLPAPLLPNVNLITGNWFKFAIGDNASCHIRSGVFNIYEHNLFERNTCSGAVIINEGDLYPKITKNYFEHPDAPCVVRLLTSPAGGISSVLLNFDDNYVKMYAGEALLYVLDFAGAATDAHSMSGCLFPNTQATMLGIVRNKNGGVDTGQGLYHSYGNHITGAIPPTNVYYTLASEYSRLTKISAPTDFTIDVAGTTIARARGIGSFSAGVDGVTTLGNAIFRWLNLYVVNAPIVGSDERIKKDISSIPQALCDFVLTTEIKQYRWRREGSDRYHYGIVITPEFIERLSVVVSIDDCGAICHELFKDENGDPITTTSNGVELGDLWQVRHDEWQNIMLEAMRRKLNR